MQSPRLLDRWTLLGSTCSFWLDLAIHVSHYMSHVEGFHMILDFGNVGASYTGKEQAADTEANITAVLVYDDLPHKQILVLLDHMQGSGKWVTIKVKIDRDIATAFRCIKVPTLIMYNSQKEETARVHGDQNIHDLLQKVME